MKKISILIALLLLIVTAKAQPVIENGVLTAWHNAAEELTVPNTVHTIKAHAFSLCYNTKIINIPASVHSIDVGFAIELPFRLVSINIDPSSPYFSSENGVLFNKDKTRIIVYPASKEQTTYAIPQTVNVIGSCAFARSEKITDIVIPATVTTIEEKAFYNCRNIAHVTIPNGVTIIHKQTFNGCKNLQTVVLPSTLTSIEYGGFMNCSKLSNINLSNSITSIGAHAFIGCVLARIDIPNNLKKIEEGAFSGNAFTGINIPNSVTSIEKDAFKNCNNLTSIAISASVKTIGQGAFGSCEALTQVNFSYGLTEIGYGAFESCIMLTEISLPGSLKIIGDYAFGSCAHLARIDVPNSVTKIGHSAFYRCNISSINIPTSMTSTGDSDMFRECKKLSQITIPPNIITISKGTFVGCENLKELNIPSSVTNIGEGAFSFSGITHVNISNSVTSIEKYAFAECKNLENITLPNALKHIGHGAFSASNLKAVSIPGSVVSFEEDIFINCEYLKRATLPNSMTNIPNGMFKNCVALTQVDIPESVTKVGINAFYSCISLPATFALPKSVSTIGSSSFSKCIKFTDIANVASHIEKIPDFAFSDNLGMENINVPEGVKVIKSFAFSHCKNLKRIKLPSTLDSLYLSVASGSNLQEILIPDNTVFVEEKAFIEIPSLRSVTFGSKTSKVWLNSFEKCPNLIMIDLSKITNIEAIDIKSWYHSGVLVPSDFNPNLVIYLPNDKFKSMLESSGFNVVVGKPSANPSVIEIGNISYSINGNSATFTANSSANAPVTLKETGFFIVEKEYNIPKNIKLLATGATIGNITCELKDMVEGRDYHVRAFATDNTGYTAYSSEISFKFTVVPVTPTENKIPVFSVPSNTIAIGASISLSIKGDMLKVFENGVWTVNGTPVSGSAWVPDKPGTYFLKVTSADGKATIERRILVGK